MPCDDIHFVTFHLSIKRNVGTLFVYGFPELLSHLLNIILVETQLKRNLSVRQVQRHEIETMHPDLQGLMVPGEDGQSQVIKAALAGLAAIALLLWLGIILTLSGNIQAGAMRASDSTRPTELSDLFVALCVIKEVMELHHAPVLPDQVTHLQSDMPQCPQLPGIHKEPPSIPVRSRTIIYASLVVHCL